MCNACAAIAKINEQTYYTNAFIALVNREFKAGTLDNITPTLVHNELYIAGCMSPEEVYDWLQAMWECDLLDPAFTK